MLNPDNAIKNIQRNESFTNLFGKGGAFYKPDYDFQSNPILK